MEKKIVIIGAGYSGVLIAKKLAKRLKKAGIRDASVTLVDRNPFHTMLTELHEVAANRVDEDSIRISLSKVFAGRKVDVRLDTVESIDMESKRVLGKSGQYPYDYLVLAAGSKPTYFGTPGAQEHTFKLWSYDDAIRLREHIQQMFRQAMRETDPQERKRLLCFNVVGAGFTGVEMAGELAEYAPILCDLYGIERDLVTIRDIDVLEHACPNLPVKLGIKVERRLKRMHVDVRLKTKVISVGPDFIETESDGERQSVKTATVIWAAGVESADIIAKVAQVYESVNRGRIKVDPYLRALSGSEHLRCGRQHVLYPRGRESACAADCGELRTVGRRDRAQHDVCDHRPGARWRYTTRNSTASWSSIGGRYGVPASVFRIGCSTCRRFWRCSPSTSSTSSTLHRCWDGIRSSGYLKHEIFTIRPEGAFWAAISQPHAKFPFGAAARMLGAVWVFEGVVKITKAGCPRRS